MITITNHLPRASASLTPTSGARAVNHRAVTAVVCAALATVVAAMSSLNVALPDIARSTGASQTQLSWVIDAYSLFFAALLLPAGAVGDRYGRRLALLGGLGIFAAGSAIAMTAGSAGELIALRAVIGLGAALVMPATLSTITSTFPPEQRTRAVSVWAGVAGGSAVLGLLVSGLLLQVWSWQSVFAVNVVLAAVSVAGTLRFVPESADAAAPRLDIGGAALSVPGLVAVVYTVIEAPTEGWLSLRTVFGVGVGLLIMAAFIGYELHAAHPMLDPRIFTRRRLSAGSVSIFMQFFAFFGFIFLVLQYLQIVRGDSAITAAVSMLPMAAAMIPTARLSPMLVARLGARTVCVSGLSAITVALVVLAQLGADSSYGLLLGGLVILGVGMGAAMTPATSAITDALPAAEQGVASAMNDLARELGGALGIAVIGSVLASSYRNHLHLPGLPAPVVDKARNSVAFAAHVGGPVRSQADAAFVDGLHAAMLTAAATTVLAAVVVAVLLPRQRHSRS